MIKNSFIFLPKIKQRKEISLWKQGITDWNKFLSSKSIKGISGRLKIYYDSEIIKAKKALYENDSGYFIEKIPTTETWRLYDDFKEESVFLDIEASSATAKRSYLTVIGLFDGIDTKIMVKDINLDIDRLKVVLSNYKVLITFNGSSFDLPFLQKNYPGLIPNVPKIDVRHLCARCGLKGGLKDIEKQLGIQRENKIVEQMCGGNPIKLWKMFKGSKDRYYLDLLVKYNEEDVINLKKITEYCIKQLTRHNSDYFTK